MNISQIVNITFQGFANGFGSRMQKAPIAYRPLSRRLDRCNRVFQNESSDPFGGNVYYVTMQITFLTRKFRNGERNFIVT